MKKKEESTFNVKGEENNNLPCILLGNQIVTKKSLSGWLGSRHNTQENKCTPTVSSEKEGHVASELLDDFSNDQYQKRLEDWIHYHTGRWCYHVKERNEPIVHVESLLTYLYTFSTKCPYILIEEACTVPRDIWTLLFPHQQKALCFLWRMHQLNIGCIVADEMGLGKTIEIIAFLGALHFTMVFNKEHKSGLCEIQRELNENLHNVLNSQNKHKPFVFPFVNALIVCPATVIQQWVHEFHEWYPFFRCLTTCKRSVQERQKVIKKASCFGSVLIVSYETLRHDLNMFQAISLSYVILDEGQKIRNPETGITIAVKKLKTSHRIILSGTPIQNDLKELWCLFDFVVPKRLGELEHFCQTYVDPIRFGTVSNATPLGVAAAQKAAESLRCLIAPHFLRRTKKDVETNVLLPPITQQILLCHITPAQYQLYTEFIKAQHAFLARKGWHTQGSLRKGYIFFALSVLRKICNHPDILLLQQTNQDIQDFGAVERSSKLRITLDIVATWHAQKHRVLVFSQTIQTLNILELHFSRLHYRFERVDGKTSLARRHAILQEFNEDPTLFMLLLTTRVGGVGLNLTTANRILIFDLDWNPMIDEQAKERSWRIGQTKDVVVYCLVVAGTIEEKIYQRQITKHALSHRILVNPYKKRLFKIKDIYDLFELPRFPPVCNDMNSLQDYTHTDNYRLFKESETTWAHYNENEDETNCLSSSPHAFHKLPCATQELLTTPPLIPPSATISPSCLDVQIPKRKRYKLDKEQDACSTLSTAHLNKTLNESSSKEILKNFPLSVNPMSHRDQSFSDDALVNDFLKYNKIQTAISHDLLMNPFEYWSVKKKRIKKEGEKEESAPCNKTSDMEEYGKDKIESNLNKVNADKLAAQFFMDRFETTVLQKDSINDWKHFMHEKIKAFFQSQERCKSDVLVNTFSQWIQTSPNIPMCQVEFKKILKMYASFDAQTSLWIYNAQVKEKNETEDCVKF